MIRASTQQSEWGLHHTLFSVSNTDIDCSWHFVMQAVIAHEMGHLKCDHGVWLTMANVLASNTTSVLPLLSGAVEDALLRWLRAAELTCDRAALLVAQDHRLVISSLMKLAGGSPKLNKELNIEAFLKQVRLAEGWACTEVHQRKVTWKVAMLGRIKQLVC